MQDVESIVEGLAQELRRGTQVLGVLSQLAAPRYGYALVETLQSRGAPIEPGTLYPLLRRLEKQGLLSSQWQTQGANPRKYYVLSPLGCGVYDRLCRHWEEMVQSVNRLIEEGRENP